MIQIEEITIENFRGVRNLTLPFNRKSFAIQGPNATGKSCVVDAIEFALTGKLSRLGGEGTGDLSIASHASHVDLREQPETAKVTVRLHLTDSHQTFTLTRSVKKPNSPKLKPDTPVARAALAGFSKRDEITLTRRQIVKYILTQATKRGEHVQELLRLDEIGKTRKVMASAERSCNTTVKSAKTEWTSATEQLKSHFGVSILDRDVMLTAINERRDKLGLSSLEQLDGNPLLDPQSQQERTDGVVRATAIRDLLALREATKSKDRSAAAQLIVELLAQLDREPSLNRLLQIQQLVQLGLDLVDEDACPLCDSPRPLAELRSHFEQKLRLSKKVEEFAKALSSAINDLRSRCEAVIRPARPVWKVAVALRLDTHAEEITSWGKHLRERVDLLDGLESVRQLREDLPTLGCLNALESRLVELEQTIEKLPDQSATIEASKFLTLADTRLAEVQIRELALERANQAQAYAQFAHRTYCRVSTDELESLYRAVEQSFADSYRSLHSDDEASFSAKLRPEEGKLELDVDFHGRGMFPPGAYHSEGHQDSMGLCLYLALMKQVFGDDLRLVVLDDVVMSVDSGHRRELCKMLKERFPKTQFVITTHEEAWFHQMQSTGLIDPKNARMFQSWTPEAGPLVSDAVHAWEQIDEHLRRNDVPAASHALRRHLEYVLPQIADRLRAKVTFSISGRHDAGVLLDGCHNALRKLVEKAEKTAQGWQDETAATGASTLRSRLNKCMGEVNREGKYVNATIHFNEWAILVWQDFEPVVHAFRDLLDCFRCESCGAWLKLAGSEMLKCDCAQTHFNLSEPNQAQKANFPAR